MKRWLPWILAAIFAAAFIVVLVAKRGGTSNEINGVTQDNSGRRVVAWVDPMYSQGPPHLYKSKHPGTAPDCGMKLVPQYADQNSPVAGGVAISLARQQLIGVKLATAERRELSRTIRTTGRVTVDERRIALEIGRIRRRTGPRRSRWAGRTAHQLEGHLQRRLPLREKRRRVRQREQLRVPRGRERGQLARLSALIAEARANVVHIEHDRAFSRWAAIGETEVELTLETTGREHVEDLKRRLETAGYRVAERRV